MSILVMKIIMLCYDDKMKYIGKGPVGYYELLLEITSVANKLQTNGFIKNKFGRAIPIIIHDLEYSWYVIEANQNSQSKWGSRYVSDCDEKTRFTD